MVARVFTPLPSFFDYLYSNHIRDGVKPQKTVSEEFTFWGVPEKVAINSKFFWERVTYIGESGDIQVGESLMVCLLVTFDGWFFSHSLFFP